MDIDKLSKIPSERGMGKLGSSGKWHNGINQRNILWRKNV
jgi:hypothetical protein